MRCENRKWLGYALGLVLTGLVAGTLIAEGYGQENYPGKKAEQPATQPGQASGGAAQGQGHHDHQSHEGHGHAMDEMHQKMMANFEAYAAAGPEHERLGGRVGQWDHTTKMWMHAGAEPMVTEGKTVTESILGGRFLLDRSTGAFMGQPFEGLGITGYDRIKKKYTGIWIDNMGTGIYSFEGAADETGDVVTYNSSYSCMMTGTVKHGKSVETVIDKDHWKLEMYDKGPDGQEFKAFEIEYRRPG